VVVPGALGYPEAGTMKLSVAEYASANQDGTFTVIRGGIEHWTTKVLPFDIGASLLLDLTGGEIAEGVAPMHVSLRDAGGTLLFDLQGFANIPKPVGRVMAVVHIGGKVASAGPLVIEAQIGLETGRQVVNVILDGG
jgi:hypothetical protein